MSQPNYESLNLTHLRVSLDGAILVIVIDRAKDRNTFISPFAYELIKVFDLADKDDRVRVVIFTADHTAPAFCSGADLSSGWRKAESDPVDSPSDHAYRDTGGQVSLAILRCRKITVSAVNGHAVGVGMTGLQLPFDFRFVWAGAKLAFPFVRRAIMPEAASTYLLPRLVGYSAATALFLSGLTYPPTHPLLAPLYYSILPERPQVFPAALDFAKELASNTSAVSVGATKALLHHPASSAEESHLLDSYIFKKIIYGGGNDVVEGVQAFKERRTPEFKDSVDVMKQWAPWWRTLDVTPGAAKL